MKTRVKYGISPHDPRRVNLGYRDDKGKPWVHYLDLTESIDANNGEEFCKHVCDILGHKDFSLEQVKWEAVGIFHEDYVSNSSEALLLKLEKNMDTLKAWLHFCLDEEDWHGVMDAAADIREVEAKMEVLKSAVSHLESRVIALENRVGE